jgi:upstream activation factor subunit UAF30
MWAYIKGHNLQDPTDKRNINLDAHMSRVFGVDKLTMFSINKALTAHLTAMPNP